MSRGAGLADCWMVKSLWEISSAIQYGFTAKARDERVGPRLLRITDIQNDAVTWSDVPFCVIGEAEKAKYLLRENDLVFARTGATVGKSYLIRGAIPESVFASYLIRVRLKDDVDPKYVAHFFQCAEYWRQVGASQSGIGQPNVNGKKLGQIQIPIAPLEQQRRIVAEIEKQFSRLDEAIANLKRVKANLKRYRTAVLKAAVEGRLVADELGIASGNNWPLKPIDVAIASMDQGWSPRCDRESSDGLEAWGVIKTTAVQPLIFVQSENKRLPDELMPREHLELAVGDVLVTRAGPRSRVGVACLIRATRPRLILCDKVYRLRARADVAKSTFLELVLNAPHIVDALDVLKTGISDSGVNLTQKRFRELSIPIPPLEEQERIVIEVERRLSMTDEMEAQADASLRRAERLRQAILKRAFEGRLG